MATVPKHYVTLEEYLTREKDAEFRSEYFRGEMFAVAGASANHNLIVLNAGASLREQLKKKPCRVYPSDLKLRIESTVYIRTQTFRSFVASLRSKPMVVMCC